MSGYGSEEDIKIVFRARHNSSKINVCDYALGYNVEQLLHNDFRN